MKGFQFFVVKRFPEMLVGQTIDNQIQACILSEMEDVNTSVSLIQEVATGSFCKIKIKSKVKHNDMIYVKTMLNGVRVSLELHEYLKAVEFNGYYDRANRVIFFQSSKKATKGVINNLKDTENTFEFVEMVVDFNKLKAICPNIKTVWIKNVNSRITQATLQGSRLQEEDLYKDISSKEHSGVIIDWPFDHNEHPVLVTANGSIALVRTYLTPSYELDLVTNIFDKLLSKIWSEKPSATRRRRSGRRRN